MLAMSLMTRIPMPKQENIRAEDYAHAAILFPLAGLLIGLGLGILAWLHSISAASSLLMAAILTVLWAVITGGLHLKGVGSSADAWIGGIGDEDKTHRILNDQITGDAGTTAIAAVLILKFAALTVLVEHHFIWSIIFAPVFGRALMLLMFAVGTASLAWMLMLAVIMAVEKNASWGRRLGRPLGVVLLGVGVGLGIYNLTI